MAKSSKYDEDSKYRYCLQNEDDDPLGTCNQKETNYERAQETIALFKKSNPVLLLVKKFTF